MTFDVREFRIRGSRQPAAAPYIGSYRKRQVKIKERESVPRKSHCLAPRFALPGGVLKILYSIVPARLHFEGGGARERASERVSIAEREFHSHRLHFTPRLLNPFSLSRKQAEVYLARRSSATSRRNFPTIV